MSSTTSDLLSPADVPQRPGFSRCTSANSVTSTASAISSKSSTSFSSSLFREKNKPRLYLALYPRGGATPTYTSQLTCDMYHWAIVVGPKSALRSEAGKVYQLVHAPASDGSQAPYYYTELDLNENETHTRTLMVRIAIGKVLNEDRVDELLRAIKIPACPPPSSRASHRCNHHHDESSEQDSDDYDATSLSTSYSCLQFCKAAYEALTEPVKSSKQKKALKCYFGPEDWKDIEARARRYIKRKRQQGRFRPGGHRNYLLGGPANWNPDEIATFNFWENRETTD